MLKKLALLLLFMLLLSSLSSFGIDEETTKQDVIDAAKNAVPSDYNYLYLIQLENILAQTDLPSAKYRSIIDIIEEIAGSVTDSGHSLDQYSEENRNYILQHFYDVCDLCGFTYEFVLASKDPEWHIGDVVCLIYDSEHNLIGEFDGDQDNLDSFAY